MKFIVKKEKRKVQENDIGILHNNEKRAKSQQQKDNRKINIIMKNKEI